MTGLGLVGTAAALVNYRKAKANYDELLEQHDALIAAIQTYTFSKDEQLLNSVKVDEVDFMPGVLMTTILRVGNLVGKFFRVQASVVLSNTSEQTYHISYAGADCKVLDMPIAVTRLGQSTAVKQEVSCNIELKPNETIAIKLPHGISALYNKDEENINGELRDLICEAAGKRLITSCPKISIEGGVVSDIMVKWRNSDETETHTAVTRNRAGVLRYCMEAFYPKD